MAIPLVAHEALTTAYINDVDGLGVFAQQLYGFGKRGRCFSGELQLQEIAKNVNECYSGGSCIRNQKF